MSMRGSELTERERQVIVLLMEGMYPDQIARRLGISRKTVQLHLSNMRIKFDVHSTIQLLVFLLRAGMVTLTEEVSV